MHHREMENIIDDAVAHIKALRETKGKEYATEEDTLADFKEVATETGTTPLQVWATYVKKHQRAIDTFVREGNVKSESIESRAIDVIVYHLLLLGLIRDAPKPDLYETPIDLELSVGPKCGKWYQIVDPSPHGHHNGEFIRCELAKDHDGLVHFGRTSEGHGFRFLEQDAWTGPEPGLGDAV